MKIIREGPAWRKEVECSECLSSLEITKKDVKVSATNHQDESHHYFCGVCGMKNEVDSFKPKLSPEPRKFNLD